MKVNLSQLKCSRCDHKWIPRKIEVRVCPHCHSPYWDRDKAVVVAPSGIEPLLELMVKKIVAACDPDKIILFGSHATGRAGPDSDVDLMIIKDPGSMKKREHAVRLYRELWDVGVSKDIVVVRPEEFERYKEVPGTIIYPAAHEGKVLYERAA